MDKTFTPALLPHYFKKIGFAYMILISLLFTCNKIFSIPFWEYFSISEEIFKAYAKNVLVLALYFIVMSKDKIEDEMTVYIRLNIMAKSFEFFCFLTLIYIFVDAYNGIYLKKIFRQEAMFMLLLYYQITYYWYKWKAKREEKRNAEAE